MVGVLIDIRLGVAVPVASDKVTVALSKVRGSTVVGADDGHRFADTARPGKFHNGLHGADHTVGILIDVLTACAEEPLLSVGLVQLITGYAAEVLGSGALVGVSMILAEVSGTGVRGSRAGLRQVAGVSVLTARSSLNLEGIGGALFVDTVTELRQVTSGSITAKDRSTALLGVKRHDFIGRATGRRSSTELSLIANSSGGTALLGGELLSALSVDELTVRTAGSIIVEGRTLSSGHARAATAATTGRGRNTSLDVGDIDLADAVGGVASSGERALRSLVVVAPAARKLTGGRVLKELSSVVVVASELAVMSEHVERVDITVDQEGGPSHLFALLLDSSISTGGVDLTGGGGITHTGINRSERSIEGTEPADGGSLDGKGVDGYLVDGVGSVASGARDKITRDAFEIGLHMGAVVAARTGGNEERACNECK